MLLRLRYTETLCAIADLADTHTEDTETHKLLDLLVFSVFYDEHSYQTERIEERINRLLNVLSLSEDSLEAAFIALIDETVEYLPGYRSHRTNHCLPAPCIQKTSSATYTLHLDKPILSEMSYFNKAYQDPPLA